MNCKAVNARRCCFIERWISQEIQANQNLKSNMLRNSSYTSNVKAVYVLCIMYFRLCIVMVLCDGVKRSCE